MAHVSFCVQMMVQALSGGEGPGLAPWLARMLRSLLRLQASLLFTAALLLIGCSLQAGALAGAHAAQPAAPAALWVACCAFACVVPCKLAPWLVRMLCSLPRLQASFLSHVHIAFSCRTVKVLLRFPQCSVHHLTVCLVRIWCAYCPVGWPTCLLLLVASALQDVIPSELQFVALEARKALVLFKHLPLPRRLVAPVLTTLEQVCTASLQCGSDRQTLEYVCVVVVKHVRCTSRCF